MRILGIDPGLQVCGYACLDAERGAEKLIEAGITVGKRWSYIGWMAGYEYVRINDDNTSTEVWIRSEEHTSELQSR